MACLHAATRFRAEVRRQQRLILLGKMSSALALSDWRQMLAWDSKEMLKARRIAFHVTRAAKKFLLGTGNAAWVMGTTMLVMVMPLAFEIEREGQSPEMAYEMPKM